MSEITKRLLHLRPNFHSYARPLTYPLHHFSSSSDPDARSDIPQPDPNSDAQTRPSLSSSISSVKSSLQQQPPPQNLDQFLRSPSPPRANSTDDIRRQLSEFRIRSAAPPPPSSTGNYVSLQELYERNVNSKGDESANSSGISSGGKPSFNPFRASLSQLNPGVQNDSGGKLSDRWSISRFAENLKLKGDANANQDSTTFSGASNSSMSSFLRGKGDSSLRVMSFRSIDDHHEMGKKLKMLRPQNRKGKWFSVQELSDRLAKLKEAQQKENNVIADIRAGILGTAPQKERKVPLKNLGFLGPIGGIESYDMLPPKTDLVEQYFHPDNMSSAEKLKLELQKVREEFKMSESDCGSARVQVAQLTLKIKHLSTVLLKKDKHSRKGLQAMVERRKKLLKYLRRTDWDSYCLVLSKLGLRDNPDVKA